MAWRQYADSLIDAGAYPEDDEPSSCRHALDANTCPECRAEFETERLDYQRWRAGQPPVETEGIEDLPF